jgi:hypothetical protein
MFEYSPLIEQHMMEILNSLRILFTVCLLIYSAQFFKGGWIGIEVESGVNRLMTIDQQLDYLLLKNTQFISIELSVDLLLHIHFELVWFDGEYIIFQ